MNLHHMPFGHRLDRAYVKENIYNGIKYYF